MIEQEVVTSGDRHNGYISVYFDTRGFGFINEVVGGVVLSYFYHLKDMMRGVPKAGERVSFLPVAGKKGLAAKEVTVGGAA
jgi:cold shock CspA family protein